MKTTIAVLSSLLILSGCGSTPKLSAKPFSDADYAPYRVPGTAVLRGGVFAVTVGGTVKVAAGQYVFLYPATDYGLKQQECWQYEYECTVQVSDEAAHKEFRRIVQADVSGQYEFTKLPAGRYVVLSSLTWQYPGPYGLRTTGGNVSATVELADGEVKILQLKL